MNKSQLAELWDKLVVQMSNDFNIEERLDLDGILFLIGVNEAGFGPKKYKKDEKINLIHVAICTVLEPFGYYKFVGNDINGWPHFDLIQPLPTLKAGEQTLLMKEAIIEYALSNKLISSD